MIIDFTEITAANSSDGMQDTFEVFSRDFLKYIGYQILNGPNRGPDRGKDLTALEKRIGVGGETIINWLVSCKHNAHSGKSVTPKDEINIKERLELHNCDGFIGMYSTIPSSGLSEILTGVSKSHEVRVFDWGEIESLLLKTTDGIQLAKRYFPNSIKQWKQNNNFLTPSNKTIISGEVYIEEEIIPHMSLSVFDIIMIENNIEQLFFKYQDNGVIELFCGADMSIAQLLNFRLSDVDTLAFENGATPDLWNYYEMAPEDSEKFGIIKIQYMYKSQGTVSLYKINYTKQELLRTKLREFTDDWDDVADG